jgi:hypothetical protein
VIAAVNKRDPKAAIEHGASLVKDNAARLQSSLTPSFSVV